MSLTELFCEVDDFCAAFEPLWHRQLLTSGLMAENVCFAVFQQCRIRSIIWIPEL